jgi:hypothetical protein
MFHVKHWLRQLIKPQAAIVLPKLVVPPDVPRETSGSTYKRLLMKQSAFIELRHRIILGLVSEMPVPEVVIDHDTNDLLVTDTYDGVKRTHRVTITEEST